MFIRKLFVASVLFFLAPANLVAQVSEDETVAKSKPSPVRFLIGVALEFGGESVAEIQFEDGDTQDVYASQGGSIGIGAEVQFPSIDFLMLQGTIGIKYVTTQADNAHIRLTRFPIELTANWLITDDIKIGAGIAAHTNINFKADGIGPDASFDNAVGPLFEASYAGFGLRYTSMTYTDEFGFDYDATAIGVFYKGTIF
ncbi:MAG: hypothetical protein ACMZ7B_01160 [Balneola sp.]